MALRRSNRLAQQATFRFRVDHMVPAQVVFLYWAKPFFGPCGAKITSALPGVGKYGGICSDSECMACIPLSAPNGRNSYIGRLFLACIIN
jgi:hypothetical protein